MTQEQAVRADATGNRTRKSELRKKAESRQLGWFLGVFTPTLLTILGVIMYLRFGWMVGNLGLFKALIIVLVGNAITFTTTLSFSAIATNTRVGVGGAYFIISRSLGIEVGGAIGLPLFLSQVFSVTLYAFGLAESFRIIWPDIPVDIAAFVIVLAVGALSFRGAQIALKAQLPIMGAVIVSIIAMGLGAFVAPVTEAAPETLPPAADFWTVFAVFFPAVTGVMAGLGLSGDLKDPSTSIPRGALIAVGVGFATYMVLPVLLWLGAPTHVLREDPLVWTRIAPLGALLILPGMWGAIFSSAVGSMLGAPRTLQALAMDHLAPRFLTRVSGAQREPIFGLFVSLAIALSAIFLGGLNAVAPVVSMFFLTIYGTVNIVAALETLSGDASWRPRIPVPWPVSLAGGLACFAVMFLINSVAGLVAITIEILLWVFLARRERKSEWGDMRRDVYEALIRWALLRLARRPMTARNWRPHIILFAENVQRRLELLKFVTWFSQERGVVTACELVVGNILEQPIDRAERLKQIHAFFGEEGIPAFAEVNFVRGIEDGIIDVAQANGLAGLESNTVMLGWPRDAARMAANLRVVQRLERLNKSVIIGRPLASTLAREGRRRLIHIWWGGLERNGDLMLLLAHLLTRNPQWRGSRIEVLSIASNEVKQKETEAALAKLLPAVRIQAQTKALVKPKEQTIREIIQQESGAADLVFLGLGSVAPGDEEVYAQRMLEMAENLNSVFFVKNASLFVGELIHT